MLHIVFPVPFVLCSCFIMMINSITMGFIFFPLSIVGIAFYMSKFAFARSFSFEPLTLVLGSIRPNLYSVSTFHSTDPLTFVLDSTLKYNHPLLLGCLIQIIYTILIHTLIELSLIFGEVLTILTNNKTTLKLVFLIRIICCLLTSFGWYYTLFKSS